MLLLGQVFPVLTDFINRNIKQTKARWFISVVVSVLVGSIANYRSFAINTLPNVLYTCLILWFSSQASYKLWYGGSNWQTNIRFTPGAFPIKTVLPPVVLNLFQKPIATETVSTETPQPPAA